MAQRRRRRARCMLHCPQRHVLGMWPDLRWRCGSDRGARWRTACYGNRDGCTHTDAHDRYPDFIPRPDETPSPNGQHAHVKSEDASRQATSSSKFVGPFILPSKFSVSPSKAHSAILFSWQTHERLEGILPINSQLQDKPFLPFRSLSQTALCIVMQEIATQPVHRAKG
jgi:hypothetical protein